MNILYYVYKITCLGNIIFHQSIGLTFCPDLGDNVLDPDRSLIPATVYKIKYSFYAVPFVVSCSFNHHKL